MLLTMAPTKHDASGLRHIYVFVSFILIRCLLVTRTEKHNDRNHGGLADGTASAEDHLPRYFAKSGHVDMDPKKVKKEGAGKGNW